MSVKRWLFRHLSLENYLRTLQWNFLTMFRLGLLRGNPEFEYHYHAKKLVKKGDVIVDIGANLGYYTLNFSRWTGPSGKVYAIEPIGVYNNVLRRAAKRRKNIVYLPYALGGEEGKVTLVTSPGVGYLRTGLPHIYDPKNDGEIAAQEFAFEAQMKRPEDLLCGLERIDLIKCDIEGFELTVLGRLKEIIAKHRPILQVEVWPPNLEGILALLLPMGYRAMKLDKGKLVPAADGCLEEEGDIIFLP